VLRRAAGERAHAAGADRGTEQAGISGDRHGCAPTARF